MTLRVQWMQPNTLGSAKTPKAEKRRRVSRCEAEQSLAADGAIACLSSTLFQFSLNADRAPQLKAVVRCLLNI